MWKWFNPWGEAARVQKEADATIAALRSWREQSTADHKHELIRLYDMITATEKRVKEAEQEARTTEQKTKELPPSSAFTPPNVGSLPLQGVGR